MSYKTDRRTPKGRVYSSAQRMLAFRGQRELASGLLNPKFHKREPQPRKRLIEIRTIELADIAIAFAGHRYAF